MSYKRLILERDEKDAVSEYQEFEVYIDARLTIPLMLDAEEKLVKMEDGYEKINTDILCHILRVSRKF